MAYVSVSDWKPEQVTEWLKGLDSCIQPYLSLFAQQQVNGQQLLNLCPDQLFQLGVYKIGHQELILEGVTHLRNFHYELDRENLQLLSLRVSCAARSVHCEVRGLPDDTVPTQVLSDIGTVVSAVKTLVSWLDRLPFAGQVDYSNYRRLFLDDSLKLVTTAHRGRFCEKPINKIEYFSEKLAKLADSIIQEATDPMILQPASLDLATLKKKAGEDLGFFLAPSYHGVHQVGDMKLSSPAHQSGKIQQGDEVVQVNYQTVVGWSRKKVLALFEESPIDLLLTLKRRPKHVKTYEQIYIKPYRLPSRKRAAPYTRWNDTTLPSPSPFLNIPPPSASLKPRAIVTTDVTIATTVPAAAPPAAAIVTAAAVEQSSEQREPPNEAMQSSVVETTVRNNSTSSNSSSSSSDEEFPPPHSTSPSSMRIYMPKPRAPIQRRFTISGPPRPSAQTELFWRELQLERSLRSNQNNSQSENQISANADQFERQTVVDHMKVIIERNKSRRDAFFSDLMAAAAVSSSGTIQRSPQLFQPPPPPPPRGRLDKSRSTPAYDLNDAAIAAAAAAAVVKTPVTATSSEHGQMVNTINQSLLLARHREDDDSLHSFFSDVPPAPREIRPAPMTRKLPITTAANVPLVPLPPKPRPRPQPSQQPPTFASPSRSTGGESSTGSSGIAAESSGSIEKRHNPLENIKAILTIGRGQSPRTARKKNVLLSKRRLISVKDLNPVDVSGTLWQRHRKGSAAGSWRQGFFVLTGAAFYGFEHRDERRAYLFIHLPGFTCSLADEVKSRPFAFKIYHTGTVFYFAAESQEELHMWLDSAMVATTNAEESGEVPGWSESDSDASEHEMPPETCFPTSPRVKKLLGHTPARSQQNLAASTSQKFESPRKFGSLKKFTGSHQNKLSESESSSKSVDVASLDRKYLRFLTGQRQNPIPVPTSQFRSYRRMQPVPDSPIVSSKSSLKSEESLKLHKRALHSSNPSLIHPEMADYRVTQERLREFRNLRNQNRPDDLSNLMTLEQFMMSRQEEERTLRMNRQRTSRVHPSQSSDTIHVNVRSPLLVPTNASEPSFTANGQRPQAMPRASISTSKSAMHQQPTTSQSDEGLSSRVETSIPPAVSTPEISTTITTTVLPDYPGIEYPPAFVPETYTLQCMLKNRKKRDK